MRYLVFIAILFAGCKYGLEQPTEPKDLIPEEMIVVLIKDLVKLEAHVQNKYARVDRFYKTLDNSSEVLLKENGVTAEQFQASMEYYANDQERMDAIYSEALNLLNKELGELQEN